MITIIEDKDLWPLCDHARHSQSKSIRISSCKGELPIRKFEPALKFLPNPNDIFIRQHQCDAFLALLMDCIDCFFRRVTCHGTGIAKAKINVVMAIYICEMGAFCLFHEYGKRTRPADHPQHRYAAVQRLARSLVEFI